MGSTLLEPERMVKMVQEISNEDTGLHNRFPSFAIQIFISSQAEVASKDGKLEIMYKWLGTTPEQHSLKMTCSRVFHPSG